MPNCYPMWIYCWIWKGNQAQTCWNKNNYFNLCWLYLVLFHWILSCRKKSCNRPNKNYWANCNWNWISWSRCLIKSEKKVTGVTTAAFIWAMSGISILIGSNMLITAIVLTLLIVTCTWIFEIIEKKIHTGHRDESE